MTDRRPKIAALVADAFQEEEYFFPKIALNEAGYQVEVVSSRKEPVEIYSYFTRTGLLDVQGAIMEARPEVESSLVSPNPAAQCQSDLARSGPEQFAWWSVCSGPYQPRPYGYPTKAGSTTVGVSKLATGI